MKKTFFAAAVLASFTFASCSQNNTETAKGAASAESAPTEVQTTSVVVETPQFSSVDEPFQAQIDQLVAQYLNLKNALVASDAEAAKTAANEVLTLAKALPVATLAEKEKAYAEDKTAQMISSAEQIAAAADVEAQRANLEPLSESVFSLAKAFGADGQTLYYQHCPMALNDKGAYWLSASKEIQNPYFGDKMLKCGSTQEVYEQ